ncbi:oxygenase MpaB family protein [Prauserella halophila]|uniref:Oxygenase MpaB family protein n=1 Tax=Prauserella halophila TaxID=185641 RepID=A0ABN1WBF0_9PSEU|nr:oxygenase MpaB family protein [Prauserella halophila]MCP2236832.1 hypothetical protein (DUF2236) [Prauserella halophila]
MSVDERLPEPDFLRSGGFRLATRLYAPGDVRGTRRQLNAFREYAQLGDPLADDVVALIERLPEGEGRALFERALTDGIDAVPDPPAELLAFFRHAEATPYWVDDTRLDAGARAIVRTGLLGLFPLGDMALMGGYLSSRATKPLVGTGALVEDMAPKRLVETTHWWLEVTTPGALRTHEHGYAAALRVRLVHAHVRAAMNRRPDWDHDAWDRPVNQVQTVGTLLLFSLVYVVGMQLLGVRYTDGERADIHHLWRYVGHLMGIDDELLPATEDDAWRLLWLLATSEFIPDDDSKRLAAALLAAHEGAGEGRGALGTVLAEASVRVHASVSRLVLGKDNADFLGLPNDPIAQGAVVAGAAANFAAESVRRVVPGATAVQQRIGELGRRQYLRRLGSLFRIDGTYARHMRPAA